MKRFAVVVLVVVAVVVVVSRTARADTPTVAQATAGHW